jgi:hypothetical protein
MSIKIRKAYDDVMAGRLSVGIEEWRMENGEPLRNGSPFTIHHSPFSILPCYLSSSSWLECFTTLTFPPSSPFTIEMKMVSSTAD